MWFTQLSELDPTKNYDGIALYSGGTDSTLAPLLAREDVGDNILLVMIDLGESEAGRAQAIQRAEIVGWDLLLTDQREAFSQSVLAEAIQMRASYWGYPLGTPLGRAFQLSIAARILDLLNSAHTRQRYVIHGCGPRQNTRFRIERYIHMLPNAEPVGPLVQRALSREEKVVLLASFGIEAVPGDGVATDQNIYCRAMEGDLLNTMGDPSALPIYTEVSSLTEASGPSELTLTFEHGCPIHLAGTVMPLHQIIERCSQEGAKRGIGRICVFEDTIPELGYKERGIYEAPAAIMLATAHRYLEGATLPRLQREIFRSLRQRWADLVYRGDWYTSERESVAEEGRRLNSPISGSVTLHLWPGSISIGSAECHGNLLLTSDASRGAY